MSIDESEAPTVLTVAELAQTLKRRVEEATAGLWVEGEVCGVKRPSSGHLYFSIKDERRDAVVDAVMYKREAFRFSRHISEGARVQLRGRASFYPPRGRLQWIADRARPSGRGALLEALERLKQKLHAEGIFDPVRKRPLPSAPRIVGVVTSKSGAAFSDIVTVAKRRGRVRLVLSPSQVQGDDAPRSIIQALDRLERLPGLDVVIVGRGGGSQEDLMAFNDEQVVRRVAACRVPVVSAVGHEIDTSLSDLAADARAATPSQAAEMVVADRRARLEELARLKRQLGQAMRSSLTRRQVDLVRCRRRLKDPRFVLAEQQQLLDELRARARAGVLSAGTRRRQVLAGFRQRLVAQHPRAVLAASRAELSPLQGRLQSAIARRLASSRSDLGRLSQGLSAMSPLAVLGRGYALATAPDGAVVRRANTLRPGDLVGVRLSQGRFTARVEEIEAPVEIRDEFDQESALGGAATTAE